MAAKLEGTPIGRDAVKRLLFALFLLLLGAAAACGPAPNPTEKPKRAVEVVPTVCTATDPHPVGVSIANRFDVDYEQVMAWFCAGETFDDILLALQTGELADAGAEELLRRKAEIGWEALWEEIGLVPVGSEN